MNRRISFMAGIRDGIPICLGYLAVSFSFGIMAKNTGLTAWQAALLSAANLTSAGQFAGLSLIAAGAPLTEMAVTQLVINLRYCLMSCALSQKIADRTPFLHRFLIAYGVTDEIFGVSVSREGTLSPIYFYALTGISALGWVSGTFIGVVSGTLLPARVISALSIALYGMFIAVIIPPARESRVIAGVVVVSMLLSLLFTAAPLLKQISQGFRIIILTLLISGAAAFLFPVPDENGQARPDGTEKGTENCIYNRADRKE